MGREASQTANKAQRISGVARWLSQLKSWVAVSEPSGQAFEQHKKKMYKNNGISRNDPQASTKLQYRPCNNNTEGSNKASGAWTGSRGARGSEEEEPDAAGWPELICLSQHTVLLDNLVRTGLEAEVSTTVSPCTRMSNTFDP
ncbi:hypothetical protein diail_10594 [Diaporthe ilicicola]|nr:hypothetical protein diail_10594 [Diaporthe ilicicola]